MGEIWKNWKTVYGSVKEDSHHAELVDVSTGEVVNDTVIESDYDKLLTYEVEKRNKTMRYYKNKIIYRNDIGDAFCSTDWSEH